MRSPDDTIVAPCSPPGRGLRAVLRLSGPATFEALEPLYRPIDDTSLAKAPAFSRLRGHFLLEDDLTLPVVLYLFRRPRSYTGEDVVEIHTLGSPPVVDRLLERLLEQPSVRLAEPGEFTRRAFLNGRLDLTQAEAVLQVIHARNQAAHRSALRVLRGQLKDQVEDMLDRLVSLAAEVEASIDFAHEDIEFIETDTLHAGLAGLLEDIAALREQARAMPDAEQGFQVLFFGAPNVGKSSLLNALVGQDRAIVSEQAGTTRDVVRSQLEDSGILLELLDPAGMREQTDDPIEALAQGQGREQLDRADLILFVLDASRPLLAEERALYVDQVSSRPHRVVINKVDLQPPESDLPNLATEPFRVSATTGEGLEQLQRFLWVAAGRQEADSTDLMLNRRQLDALKSAQEALEHVQETIGMGLGFDLMMVDLHGAMDALGELVGKVVTDDILDRIFSEFCIGK